MRIVICDDSVKEIAFIKSVLENSFSDCQIEAFEDGDSLIEHLVKCKPDIILLDVEMPGLNGIETAKKIREIHDSIKIIYITAHAQFALEAFGVYAFDFIIKPVNKQRLVKSVTLAGEQHPRQEKYIEVNNQGTLFRVNEKDITFIEKCFNRCIVYTEDFVYDMKTTLKYFEERLDSSVFLRTHNGFIVNINKIVKITSRGNLAYDIHFSNTDKKASLSRGMNEKLKLI